jgi:transposase InsO family protein
MLAPAFEEHGIKLGRDGMYNLLDTHGLLIRKRKRKPRTTDSDHPYRKYPNLIKDLMLSGPGQLWVSDITYLRLREGFCYLSIVTDAYSRKIVGYKLHPSLHSEGAIAALTMASEDGKRTKGLIHHSDRGVQYCCGDYVRMLEHYGIRISMTENGDPYENALAERVNGILKEEFSLDETFPSFAAAEAAVDEAIRRYNHLRPHASCDYQTPVAAHEQSGILNKRWRVKARKSGADEGPASSALSALST